MRIWQFPAALLMIGLTTAAGAEEARGLYTGGGLGLIAGLAEVRAELKITELQHEKLQALRGELRGSVGGVGDPVEGRKRMEEMNKKADETIKQILDEKQQQRLWELIIQKEGARTFTWPNVAEKLGLDQAQKDQINKIRTDNAKKQVILSGLSPEERKKAQDEANSHREKVKAELLTVLTADQKEAFQKMQGTKFAFPEARRKSE